MTSVQLLSIIYVSRPFLDFRFIDNIERYVIFVEILVFQNYSFEISPQSQFTTTKNYESIVIHLIIEDVGCGRLKRVCDDVNK